ncbi:MAG: hypothetical protein AB8F34_15965 [Akkermansiaceae bacterium]
MFLPIGVVIGTAVFMWMYYANHKEESNEQKVIVATGIRMTDLQDMVGKFTGPIGVRTIENNQGRTGLRLAASMIQGRLGPQNLGLKIYSGEGTAAHDRLWKSLWVDVRGGDKVSEVVIAAVPFTGAGEVADANTVSTLMMLASSLANEKPSRTIRLVFLPIDRPQEEQNQWLLSRCLQEGELCVGIVGIDVMRGSPKPGDPNWVAAAPNSADKDWWEFLSSGGKAVKTESDSVPSVWLTHAVYSDNAWVDRKEQRLEETINVARQLREWLLKAAS